MDKKQINKLITNRIDDDRFETTIRSIKGTLSILVDDKDLLPQIISDARKQFIELLYGSELIAKTTSCKSQARHKFDVAYAKKMRELVSEGVLEYHPLNESKIVLCDLYQSKEMRESKTPSKKAFLSIAPNVSFDSFLDDVVKVEKVVKS